MVEEKTRESLRTLRKIFRENTLNILSILCVSPLNPREIAKILDVHETKVARELRRLEELGVVKSSWARVGNRNVKLYSLAIDGLKITFSREGVKVHLESSKYGKISIPITGKTTLPRVSVFVGREQELAKLKNELYEKTVVAVTGIAGIGKTTLVAYFVNNYVNEPVFWHQFTESDTFEYLSWKMAKFLNSLGYHGLLEYLRANGRSYSIIKDLVLEGFSKIKTLIVLDDYQKVTDTKVLQLVKDMVSRLNVSKMIIISRKKPKGILWRGENVGEITVRGLKIENLVDLFRIKNLKIKPSYIVKIYEATLGHPLMLIMFVNVAKKMGVEKAIASLYFGDSFKFLWSEVYSKLSFKEKKIVNILSLADEPMSYEALKVACDSKDIYPILSKLVDSDLVYEVSDKYSLHDLIKGFLRIMKPFDEKEIYRKIAEAYLHEGGFKNAILALKYFVNAEDPKGAYRALMERRKQAYMLLRFLESYMRILQDVYRKIHGKHKWRRIEAHVLYDIGNIYRIMGHENYGLKYINESIDLARKVRDLTLELLGTGTRAYIYVYLGDLDKAYRDLEYTESLLHNVEGNSELVLEVKYGLYANFVLYYAIIGNFEKAHEYVKKELEVAEERGDPVYYGDTLMHLGDTYIMLGKMDKAEKVLKESIRVLEGNGDKHIASIAATSLALVYLHKNSQLEKAAKMLDEACNVLRSHGNIPRYIEAAVMKALVNVKLGNLNEALTTIEEAMAQYRRTKWDFAGILHIAYGIILKRRGDVKRGMELVEKGLRKVRESKLYSKWASVILNALGEKVK